MAVKTSRKRHQPIGDPNDPQGMVAMMGQYIEWRQVRNFAERTIETQRDYLRYFIDWCAVRGVSQPAEVTKPIIERYQRFMYHYRKRNGDPLSFCSQHGRLVPIRGWFRWMARNNHILYNPASDIELPRVEHRLPKHVLTISEVEMVINQPNVNVPRGLRDRAILETFYSTGIRRMEMINLHPYDLDVERGIVVVRQGKGKKDRVIPIGDRAVAWVERYLIQSPGTGPFFGSTALNLRKIVGRKHGPVPFAGTAGGRQVGRHALPKQPGLPILTRGYDPTRTGVRQRRRHRQAGGLPPVPPHDGHPDAGKWG